MKPSEFTTKDTAEIKDFQNKNLRGKSFQGQDLSGADFREADLRGTKFTGANLRGTKFTGAKCGLQKRWLILLTILSWLFAGLSGLFSLFNAYIILLVFNSNLFEDQITGGVGLLTLLIFLIVIIHHGTAATLILSVAKSIALESLELLSVAKSIALGALEAALLSREKSIEAFGKILTLQLETMFVAEAESSMLRLEAIAATTAALFAAAVLVTLLVTSTALVAIVLLFAPQAAILVAAALGDVPAVLAAVILVTVSGLPVVVLAPALTVAGLPAVVLAPSLTSIGVYIGWRSTKGNPRDAWISSFAVGFAALGGTNFRGADLTGANFSSARLKSTDMRKATLTGVRWFGADMIDRVRTGDTYLKSNQVRQWLIGQGIDKNFDGQKLQGVNFQGADLSNASFISANLNQASFQDANLTNSNFMSSNLKDVNLEDSNLTKSNFINVKKLTPSQIKLACNWDKAIYKGNYKKFQWIFDDAINKQYIEKLKRNKASNSENPVNCSH